jgi:hypothetical protein
MSVRRQQNWISQQRVDVPHMRSVESAVANDFDEMLRAIVTGVSAPYVIRGFEINMTGSIGAAANGLQLLVADGALLHGTSRQAGTFYVVPTGTSPEILNSTINSRVNGAFTPNAVNYIGIEYERVVDDTTSDQIYLWNPTTKNEVTKTAPLAKILRYQIVITTSIWATNVLPIAKVTTDVANNVVDVTDQRPMLYRLGTAGRSNPNPAYAYPWSNQVEGRQENPVTSTSSTISPFRGGDKMILNLKEWMDAVMSGLKELKGTVYWYSPNIGGSAVNLRTDLGNTVFTSRGYIEHSPIVQGKVTWSQDIFVRVVGSRLNYKILANPSSSNIVLTDDQVAYMNFVRGVTITPNLIFTGGSPTVASVGSVSWTSPLQAGDWVKLASDDDTKYYQILTVDSLAQVTLTENFAGASTGPSGAKSQYAWGVYQSNASPSSDRHIRIVSRKDVPSTENMFWLFLRSDNADSIARVYARFAGQELEQGERVDVNDNSSKQIIEYIGSTGETDNQPIYSNKLGTLTAEVTNITCPAASSITSGQYFTINSAGNARKYYVWYNKASAGGNPAPLGLIPIQVNIGALDNSLQVAIATASAIDASTDFGALPFGSVVTVSNSVAGACTDATNVNVGGAFLITVTTQGSGASNYYLVDTENLTIAIKRLDQAIFSLTGALVSQDYEEKLEVVSGSPANTNEVTGPITAPQNLTLPLDSRNFSAALSYIVGQGELQVTLNGQKLTLGVDYAEVGASGSNSGVIRTLIDLVVGDLLVIRKEAAISIGGGGSGGGEVNTASNVGVGVDVFKTKVGVDLQFKRLKAGAGVTLTPSTDDITFTAVPTPSALNVVTVSGSPYIMTAANDLLLVANAGSNVTVTLPSAVGNVGKVLYIKKTDVGNTLYVASVSNQTLDGVNITASPYAITVPYETLMFVSDGSNWWVL